MEKHHWPKVRKIDGKPDTAHEQANAPAHPRELMNGHFVPVGDIEGATLSPEDELFAREEGGEKVFEKTKVDKVEKEDSVEPEGPGYIQEAYGDVISSMGEAVLENELDSVLGAAPVPSQSGADESVKVAGLYDDTKKLNRDYGIKSDGKRGGKTPTKGKWKFFDNWW